MNEAVGSRPRRSGRGSGLRGLRGHVHNGNAAYAAMISAIEEAERYVVLCSYIFRSDEAGMPVIEALLRAHQRGVEVRVLLDGIGRLFQVPTVVAVEIAEVKNVNGDGATG